MSRNAVILGGGQCKWGVREAHIMDLFQEAGKACLDDIGTLKPSDIDGDWMGTLDAGAVKLRVAFHITNTGDGLTATMDSIDQGTSGIPVTKVTRNESSLKMELKGIGGAFEGKIDKALTTIEGTWSQPGTNYLWCSSARRV